MSNYIGTDEVAHYNAAANTWWQKDGPMWPLHELNDLRAPYVTEQIAGTSPLHLSWQSQ